MWPVFLLEVGKRLAISEQRLADTELGGCAMMGVSDVLRLSATIAGLRWEPIFRRLPSTSRRMLPVAALSPGTHAGISQTRLAAAGLKRRPAVGSFGEGASVHRTERPEACAEWKTVRDYSLAAKAEKTATQRRHLATTDDRIWVPKRLPTAATSGAGGDVSECLFRWKVYLLKGLWRFEARPVAAPSMHAG